MKKVFLLVFLAFLIISPNISHAQTTVKKVVLQGFWWDFWNTNYPNAWSDYLLELTPRLKSMGIDAVWIPPTIKNAGTNSVGYGPFDQYDLGDKYQKNSTTTRFGTKDQLLEMIAVMHANGIEVIQDIVLNHCTDAGAGNSAGGDDPAAYSNQWKNFRYVCYKTPVPYASAENATEYLAREGRWSKNWENFHPHLGHNTEAGDWAAGYWGPDFCYGYLEDGTGNGYGQSSNAVYNPVQNSGYNRDQARAWILWLKKQTAVDGFRWDAVKHFPYFVVQDLSYNLKYALPAWAQGGEGMYNVGEYVDFNKAGLDAYVNNVKTSNGGSDDLIGTFDFDLRDAFYNVISAGGAADLGQVITNQQNDRVVYYAIPNMYVHRTAPFVNNHDTFRPTLDASGNYTGWNTGSELAPHIDPFDNRLSVVYAIMFAVDGNPQVFFEDLFNIGNTGKRYSHLPTNAVDLPVRDDIANIIWCHQNLYFKEGAYRVRWQAVDALVIERSAKALIATNDNWNTWQNLTGVQTDFADGTQLKDYSGANGTAVRTVYGGGKVDISIPPCDGTALAGRKGYSIWAPVGMATTYSPMRITQTQQEWEMANDLGDSDYRSLGQGGETKTNSTNQQLVGKIFVKGGSTVTYSLYPKNSSISLDINLYDLNGTWLSGKSGLGTQTNTYIPTQDMWISLKVNNTLNNVAGQGCYVNVTYTAPTSVVTSTKPAANQAAIWTGRISADNLDPRNWETGTMPSVTRDLVIPTQNKDNALSLATAVSCKNLIVGDGITLNIQSTGQLTVSQTANTSTNSNVNIKSGAQVTISGNFTNLGTLTLESPTGYNVGGSLITNGTISGTGTVNVKRYFNVNHQWQYVSSPMTNQQSDIFTVNSVTGSFNPNMYSYNEASGNIDPINANYTNWASITDAWQKTQPTSGVPVTLNSGQGYIINNQGDFTANFTSSNSADLFTGDKILPVTYTDNDNAAGFGNYYDGWNLLGNPFVSALDWTLLTKTATMDNAIYLWDSSTQNYVYFTQGDPQVQGVGQTLNSNVNARYIPAMQSFMVHLTKIGASDVGTTTTENFTLANAARVHSSLAMFRNAETTTNFDFIKLKVDKNGHSDEALIRFVNTATTGFDSKFDAFKIFVQDNNFQMLYSLSENPNYPMAINTMPQITGNQIITLGFKAVAGKYTILADQLNINSENDVYLFDALKNQKINLNVVPSYTFIFAGGDVRNRFFLITENRNTTSVTNFTNNNIKVWYNTDKIFIELKSKIKGDYSAKVYDILGKEVFSTEVSSALTTIPFHKNRGIYIVKIKDRAGKESSYKISVE